MIGDIICLQFDQSIQSDVIHNTFYYKVEADSTTIDNEDAVADEFLAAVIPKWQPCVTADLSMDCLGTQKVFPTPLTAFREKFIDTLGTAVGTALPIVATALLQKFDPATSGKGKKGHSYISGVSEDDAEAGRISQSLVNKLVTLGLELTKNLTTVNDGIYSPVWATFSAIAPIVVDGSVDWIKTVVMPRLAHIGSRKTPIRKVAP